MEPTAILTDLVHHLLTLPVWLPPAIVQALDEAGLDVAFDAKEDIKRITDTFLGFGQYIATGICALAILVGFIMIATSHGSNARAENGRQAVIAGLTGLVGVALVGSLVGIITGVFSQLGPVPAPR
jgi:hypothetical protein